MRSVLAVGAVLGFLSVAIGASAEHALRPSVSDEVFRHLMTAVRYHQIGALIVTAIGLALLTPLARHTAKRLALSGWLFVAGTLLFSFSIYLSAVLNQPAITMVTPVGGITLMLGWLVLAWAALTALPGRSPSPQ
ncbi:uncharacterized membrane protein YgdD (TMEM256/DUF423 family) [Natronocella acetinitrilica]|uniref:Uncharacterized membrane protein YgdD (TMEM256/DUF423 family) n=1 Tax=Natronocella acetinitrilica TaxID=414046 RepID=A0AAE3KHI7_9GAMM|nr:DUF423 domain-containing protein [Natronocella acetinitrilica]MCP1676387.1 uncharacterized membrane protein YgdD (TMEM256/DUF423 family) [Natronocella acetinitrilica]